MKVTTFQSGWLARAWWPWRVGRSIRLFVFAWSLGLWLTLSALEWLMAAYFHSVTVLDFSMGQWAILKTVMFACALWCVLRQAFKPVVLLGQDLVSRRTEDLRQVSSQQPTELVQLAAAVNGLMLQQQASLDQQKKFLADASHQLRTPFAVLRTQLQGVMSGQLDARETLPKMLSTVDRSSDLVRQLLAIAKVDQLVRQASWTEVCAFVGQEEVGLFIASHSRTLVYGSLDAGGIDPQSNVQCHSPYPQRWRIGAGDPSLA